MNIEFQNINENGIGKLFAILNKEELPVGQLFYSVDDQLRQVIINHIYIPRKWSREQGIRESLIAEIQNLYPTFSISMKENQKEAALLKESPARSKAQFRYMQGICNGSIDPPEGMTRAKACEFVEGQKNYKKLPEKKESVGPRIRQQVGLDFTRDIIGDYVAGHSFNEISTKYNITPLAIRKILTDNQIPVRPRGGGYAKHHPRKRKNKDVVFPIKKEKEKENKGNWREKRLLSPKDEPISKDKKLHYRYDFDFDSLPEEMKREIEERRMLEELGEAPYIPIDREGSGNQYEGDFIPLSESIFQDKKMKLRDKNKRMEYLAKWKIANEYTHLNDKGEPCNCHFYKPEYKESKWKQVTSSKLDKIIKDDPKVLRTEEGQKVLEWMKGLPEQVDDLLPWIVREYKKKRLAPWISDDDIFRGMAIQDENLEDGISIINDETLNHWADWFNSNSPTRRGVDIMQLTTEDMINKIKEWDEELSSQMEEAIVYEGAGKVVYAFPDGWTMREVAPEECSDEGAQMGHCVGGHGYAEAVRRGDIKIISLRDEKNRPHATLEITNDGHVEQIQGKENLHPISKYRRRIRTFIEDPQGFQNLFGVKAIQKSNYPIARWDQLDEDMKYYTPTEDIPPINEEEFGPEWNDPRAPGHPAGASSYSRGLRGPHYGIIPQESSVDYATIINRSGYEDLETIDKLYEIAKIRNELPLLEKAVNEAKEKTVSTDNRQNRLNLKIIPNFDDQSVNGWREIFEKETGMRDYELYPEGPQRQEAEKEYKEMWQRWINNLYSSDYKTLINNLTRINVKRDSEGEYDRTKKEIKNILDSPYAIDRLHNLINSIQTTEAMPSYRPSFGLPPREKEIDQLSLISKWEKRSKWRKI